MTLLSERKVDHWSVNDDSLSTLKEISQGINEGKKIHEILGLSEEQAQEWYRFGFTLIQEERYQDAADVLMLLTFILPDYPNVWMAFGAASFRLEEWENSIDAYRQVLTLNVDIAETYVRIMQCYKAKGNINGAEAFFHMMESLIPDNEENKGWYDLAKDLLSSGG